MEPEETRDINKIDNTIETEEMQNQKRKKKKGTSFMKNVLVLMLSQIAV